MNKKQGIAVLIALATVVGIAAFYLPKSETPPTTTVPEEFNEVDEMFNELDDFLSFEDQDWDFDMGELENVYG